MKKESIKKMLIAVMVIIVASVNVFTIYQPFGKNDASLMFEDIEAMAFSESEANQQEWDRYLEERFWSGFNWFEKLYFKMCDGKQIGVYMCVGGLGTCTNFAEDNERDWKNACR